MRPIFNKSAAGVVLALAIIGYAAAITPSSAQDDAADPVTDRTSDEARELRQKAFDRKALERAEPQESEPVTGEVPDDLLQKIKSDLEKRASVSQSDFELLRAEAVRWNDGALGCPEPGEMYQQVPVNGYRVVIKYQEKEYDYRASDRGYFKLCPGFSLTRQAPVQ